MMRVLVTAELFGVLLIMAPGIHAQGLDARRFSGPLRDYQIDIAKILIVRGRSINYRTLAGGTARLEFVLDKSGIVERSRILTTSGSPYIDALAMEVVRVGSRFPPIPKQSGLNKMTINVPLRFAARP